MYKAVKDVKPGTVVLPFYPWDCTGWIVGKSHPLGKPGFFIYSPKTHVIQPIGNDELVYVFNKGITKQRKNASKKIKKRKGGTTS